MSSLQKSADQTWCDQVGCPAAIFWQVPVNGQQVRPTTGSMWACSSRNDVTDKTWARGEPINSTDKVEEMENLNKNVVVGF